MAVNTTAGLLMTKLWRPRWASRGRRISSSMRRHLSGLTVLRTWKVPWPRQSKLGYETVPPGRSPEYGPPSQEKPSIIWGMKKALVVLSLLALFLVSGFAILAMPIGQVAGATTSVAAPIGDSKSRLALALDREISGPVWLSPLKGGIRNAVSRGGRCNKVISP